MIVALIVGGAFYFINDRTTREVYAHQDDTVRALSKTIAEQAGLYIINRRSDVEFDELVVSYYSSNSVLRRIVLTDSTGNIIAHSDDIHNIRKLYTYPTFARPDLMDEPQRAVVKGEETNYLIVPIRSGERVLGAVHATYSSEPMHRQLAEARNKTLQVTGLLMFVGVVGIYLLSNYFVKPIVNITRRVRRFSSGDLDSEVPIEGTDEFFEISRALNEMMIRLRRDRETAIERERMAKEIEVASQIQKTLLPRRLPELPGLEISAFYRAASMIGGDLYDVFQIDDRRCCLVVADVSGKGVPASLVMSMLRTVIKIYTQAAKSVREILTHVDEYLSENIPAGMFITVLMAIYDVEKQKLHLASAGHNPLLLYKAGTRRVVRLNPSGIPLGVPVTLEGTFGDALEEIEVCLEHGDVFFLYTDGITEAVDREGRQYGVDRLADFLQDLFSKKGAEVSVKELSDDIINELDGFAGFASQRDDVTFVIGRATVGQTSDEQTRPAASDSQIVGGPDSGETPD
jgi:sigma-B regulation protein RsbU (phosphoserine phosphatase)